jgi:cytochrome c oxidase assembly factor CtaG
MVGVLCLVVGCGYWVAGRRPLRLYGARRRWTVRTWRAAAFFCALLLILLTTGPADALARQTFWMRTAQLMLLLMVASPLLVLGAPGPRFGRLRRRAGDQRGRGKLGSVLAFALFSAVVVGAYVPAVYRATAMPGLARDLGQATVIALGYGFWAQVIAQPGRTCALSHLGRVAYLFLSSAQVRILGLVLGFAPVSFYGVPLIDQQIAAGILMVPGILTDLVALTVCLYLWLAQDERHQGGSDTGGRRVGLRPAGATTRAMASSARTA